MRRQFTGRFGYGNGVVVDVDPKNNISHVLTCFHNIKDVEWIRIYSNGWHHGHVINFDQTSDLALVQINAIHPECINIVDSRPPNGTRGQVLAYEKVQSNNKPKMTLTVDTTIINNSSAIPGGQAWYTDAVRTSYRFRQGMSGGLLRTSQGMVGLISASVEHGVCTDGPTCLSFVQNSLRRQPNCNTGSIKTRPGRSRPPSEDKNFEEQALKLLLIQILSDPEVRQQLQADSEILEIIERLAKSVGNLKKKGTAEKKKIDNRLTALETALQDIGDYDDTEIRELISGLEENYSDLQIQRERHIEANELVFERIGKDLQSLNDRIEAISQYDDTDIKRRLTQLENKSPSTDTTVENTLVSIETRLKTLESKKAEYDDSGLKKQIADLQTELAALKVALANPEKTSYVLYFTSVDNPRTKETDKKAKYLKSKGVPIYIITLRLTKDTIDTVPRTYTIPQGKEVSGASNVITYLSTLTF